MPDKTKIHTVYKVNDKRVPSVTTILGILNKPQLMDWAWRMGVEGKDYKAVRDQAGGIGSLVHYLILCDLKKEKPDTSESSPADLDKAETCLIKYWDWQKAHKLETILCETPLVSELLGYGGTPDWFGKVDGELTIVDFKSGKGIYDEFIYQVAAYAHLVAENNHGKTDVARIVRIGRNEDEGFDEKVITDLKRGFEIFSACLHIYNLRKEK